MRAVVQRARFGRVRVEARTVGEIGPGLVVLVGAKTGDGTADADYLAEKIVNLRIFEDDEGRMNRSLLETGGDLLVVSQFTLYGDCRKGRRPSFVAALAPTEATLLIDRLVERCRTLGVRVETGEFGAKMAVELLNDGPVTLLLDSEKQL